MDGGYNLDNDDSCGLSATGSITNTDPLLSSLADNGGETETHALQFDSPALDAIPAANCATTADQRGIARPQNGLCDIGAVEMMPFNCFVETNGDNDTDFDSTDATA